MLEAALAAARSADALIMAAAVADFRPAQRRRQKLRKREQGDGLRLDLEPTADVLLAVAEQRSRCGRPRYLVGFAAESEQLLQRAAEKLARKKLDLVVANDISAADAGFEVDDNRVTLLAPDRAPEELPLMSKSAVAELVVARVAGALIQQSQPGD